MLAPEQEALAQRATAAFGLPPGVLHDLPLHLRTGAGEVYPDFVASSLVEVLNSVWYWTRARLDAASQNAEPWLGALQARWASVLPDSAFPRHDDETIERLLGSVYVASPGRDVPQLFRPDLFSWRNAEGDLAWLVLDNDVRALFYEALAVQLQELYEHDDATTPTVRYVGGCLRGPLQLSYAASSPLARASVPAERRIAAWWAEGAQKMQEPVRLPVWVDAVLASQPRDPDQVAERVRQWRERARPFRQRRASLQAELARGDAGTAKQVQDALFADVKALSADVADLGSAAVKVAVTAVAPPAADLAAVAANAAFARSGVAPWMRLAWLRVRRPHLWVVAEMSRQALGARQSLDAAGRAFGFPSGVADELPAGFLSRISRATWSV